VSLDPLIFLKDTPGVMIPRIDSPEQGMKLSLTGAIKDEIAGESLICDYLLFVLNKLSIFDYVKKYGLEGPTDDIDKLVNHLKKKYNWNEEAICRAILKDYRKGRLGKFTLDKINT